MCQLHVLLAHTTNRLVSRMQAGQKVHMHILTWAAELPLAYTQYPQMSNCNMGFHHDPLLHYQPCPRE